MIMKIGILGPKELGEKAKARVAQWDAGEARKGRVAGKSKPGPDMPRVPAGGAQPGAQLSLEQQERIIERLLIAVGEGKKEEVEKLLKAGADVNGRRMVARESSDGRPTPLMVASERGCLEIVRLLLDAGANADVADDHKRTALMFASSSGNADVAGLLLDRGANVNAGPHTPLMCACAGKHAGSKGYRETVKLLLARGADVHAVDPEYGTTALLRSIFSNDVEIVRMVLDAGADVNAATKDGETALMGAAVGKLDIAKLLIERGANVDAQNSSGDTALIRAVSQDHTEIVRVLLDAGWDIDARNRVGKTALSIAIDRGNTEIAEILRARKARMG